MRKIIRTTHWEIVRQMGAQISRHPLSGEAYLRKGAVVVSGFHSKDETDEDKQLKESGEYDTTMWDGTDGLPLPFVQRLAIEWLQTLSERTVNN